VKVGAHGYADMAFRPRTTARRRRWTFVALFFLVLAGIALGAALLFSRQGAQPSSLRESGAFPIASADPTRMVVSDPKELRPVSVEDARAINAARPYANVENPPGEALIVPTRDPASYARSLECMTSAIYYEAASEPLDGQRAVAQVILNRIRHPAFPATVCGVVYQGSMRSTGCQFSFTCDGSEARPASLVGWMRARQVALAALAGYVFRPVGLSTFYHADYVSPYWAPSLLKVITLGRHIFYRWGGGLGAPRAFTGRYAGMEPEIVRNMGSGDLALTPEGASPLTQEAAASLPSRPVLGQAGKPMLADGTAGMARPDTDGQGHGQDGGGLAPAVRRERFVLGMTGTASPDAGAKTQGKIMAGASMVR